ncbi:MAG: GxxExxY protein [Gemmatimonadota bacterium]|nr:GxxExxY protein [Gemmatimonadota bacterium]
MGKSISHSPVNTDAALSSRRYSEVSYPEQRLTGLVIAAGYAVHRAFGFGFLESVYRRAMAAEMQHRSAVVQQEVPFKLLHLGVDVGVYRADIIAESRIIVEVKTGLLPDPIAPVQLLNYLAASGLELGLVIHFGPHLEVKRVIRSH